MVAPLLNDPRLVKHAVINYTDDEEEEGWTTIKNKVQTWRKKARAQKKQPIQSKKAFPIHTMKKTSTRNTKINHDNRVRVKTPEKKHHTYKHSSRNNNMSYKDILLQREFAGAVATRSSTSTDAPNKKEPADEEEVTFDYDSEATIAPPSGVATATSVATAAGKVTMPAADEDYDETMAEQVASLHLPVPSDAEKVTSFAGDTSTFGAMFDELPEDERKMPASMLSELSDDERKMPARQSEHTGTRINNTGTVNYGTAFGKLPQDTSCTGDNNKKYEQPTRAHPVAYARSTTIPKPVSSMRQGGDTRSRSTRKNKDNIFDHEGDSDLYFDSDEEENERNMLKLYALQMKLRRKLKKQARSRSHDSSSTDDDSSNDSINSFAATSTSSFIPASSENETDATTSSFSQPKRRNRISWNKFVEIQEQQRKRRHRRHEETRAKDAVNRDKRKATKLASKLLTILNRSKPTVLHLSGSQEQKMAAYNNFVQSFKHAFSFYPETADILSAFLHDHEIIRPTKEWIDNAIFTPLDIYISPQTRNALDSNRITSSGCDLLELLMEQAYGDRQLHQEEAMDKFLRCEIKPNQTALQFIDFVQARVNICRSWGEPIDTHRFVRQIIRGIGSSHPVYGADITLLRDRMNNEPESVSIE